jgi:polyisoprenoid-binding protein YceI
MKRLRLLMAFLLLACTVPGQNYTPVDSLSKVHFIIKNFGLKTDGDFTGLKGTIVFDPDTLANSRFNVSVNSATIKTNNEARDEHLRKSDYFDVEKFPVISFESTSIAKNTSTGDYCVEGNLTIKGTNKKIQFNFTAKSVVNGYFFKGEFDINRLDFGVGGNSLVMAENVKIFLGVIAVK